MSEYLAWNRSRDADYKIATYGLLCVISQCDNEEKCRDVVEVEGVEQRVIPSWSLLLRMLPNVHRRHPVAKLRLTYTRSRSRSRSGSQVSQDHHGRGETGKDKDKRTSRTSS